MSGEEQVAQEPRFGALVVDREIGAGVGRFPSFQDELASAEIEFELFRHEHGRKDDPGSLERLGSDKGFGGREIAVGAGRQRLGKVFVSDKDGARIRKGGVAERVIGMHVRVDHVADGPVRMGADGREEPAARESASLGVHDGHGVPSDDEAGIGDGAPI